MRRFRYCGDALFLMSCAAYWLNRWLVKPWAGAGFMADHFNDLWLIPCALPPVLWLHRRMKLRPDDAPPRLAEITGHLVFWSCLFEWAGPVFFADATGDLVDVAAYACGAFIAWLWWSRDHWLAAAPAPHAHEL